MATIEEMANALINGSKAKKTGANKTAGVQGTSAVKSVSVDTGSAGTTAKKPSIEEMANQLIKQSREYKAAHPMTNTATTTTAPKPYVSYADYGQGLLDRVNETEERAMKLGSLLERAPAIISGQDQTLRRVEAEADSVFKSGAWATNPLVFDMYKGLYDQRNLTAEKIETMRNAYGRLVTDAQKAWEDYLTAVDEYNGFFGFTGDNDASEDFHLGSGAAWDTWRGSIRSADTIQPELEAAQKKVKALTEQTDRERAEIDAHADDFLYTNGGVETPEFTSRRQALADKERELEEAKKQADTLQEEMDFSKYLKWETLKNNADYAEKSAYAPKEGWKGEFNALAGRYKISDYDAFEYEYVNKNPDAQGAARVNDVQSNAEFLGVSRSFLEEMEPEEVSMYNYIFATQGADKAREYLQDLETSLTARKRETDEKDWREYAAKDGWGASAFSVLASPLKTLSYMGQTADYLQDGKIDQNAGYNKFSYINSAIRDEVAKTIEASGKWGKVGSFLYQTGMSMADFVYTTAISGGFTAGGSEAARKAAEGISLAIMGTGAAADSVIEAKDRGLSDNQAFALGTIAGLAEVVTEKVSLETLLNGTKWSKSAVGYFLANTLAEGSEEGASDLINWAADILIAQDQSQWREDIRTLMAAHPDWSEDRAFGEALKNKAAEIGLDVLGGSLSGGIMAAPGSANMAVNARRLGSSIQMGGMDATRALIEQGRSYGPKTPAAKLAADLQNKISSGGTPTKAELGYLDMANRNAAEEQGAKREKEEKKSAPVGAEMPQNTATAQNEQTAHQSEMDMAPNEGTEATPESGTMAENEELSLAERKVMLEKRESALQERGNKYLEAVNRGEDTGDMGNELNREADAIEEERRAIEAEERARELRAENEELSARQRALTVAPTESQLRERRARAGNLRELERSGRESGATEGQIETARRLSNATGRKIVFTRENSAKRGYYQSGTIYVNAAYGNEIEQIVAHELTHSIEASDFYEDFSRLVQQRIQETTGDLEARLDEIKTGYTACGVDIRDDADAMLEVVAEYVEQEFLTNEEAVTSLVTENRSLGRRIMDLLDKLLAKLGVKSAKERAFVQSARDLYARALVETRSNVNTQAALDEARIALANGEISDEEFDSVFDALGVGIEEGETKHSIAVSQRQEVAGRLRSMLNSGASIREIQRYVNSVAGTETRQSPAGTKSDGARQIVEAAHRSNMSVDEYLRQNWDEYEVDGELSADARRAMEMEGRRRYSISRDEIQAIQNIGRKSVNDFSSQEIEQTEGFARRYWQEMGPKSPFFRAWFGDWRVNDNTPVQVANVRGDNRGVQRNEDTGWNIRVSGMVFNETKVHKMFFNQQALQYLPYINDIVKKAVLLDSYAIGNTKSINSLMMHSLYTVADIGNGPELLKLYVEEMNDPNDKGTTKRAYQLQNIENSSLTGASAIGSGKALASLKTANVETIADLFAAVKSKDKHFNPKPASKVVDEDGKPLVVYHGTDADFTVFDRSKGRSNMDIQGSFFTPWEIDAGGYGQDVRAYYLDIKNPAPENVAYRALNRFKSQNNAGVLARQYLETMGYDGVNNSGEEYIAFKPEQIKLAEGNRGTFDRSNPDIRYSIDRDAAPEDTDSGSGTETDIRSTLPAKAKGELQRVERGLVSKVGAMMQVPRLAQRKYLTEIAQKISREYLTEGRISQETRDELFEEAYNRGVEVDREFYDQYKDLKKRLRETAITISETDQADIADFGDFKKSAFGKLRIVKDGGTPVDTVYQELTEAYPGLFTEEITHPADQLMRMYEVADSIRISEKTLDEALGSEADLFKSWMKNDFESAIGDAIVRLRNVKRYTDDRTAQAKAPETVLTLEEVKELYPKARDARKNYEKVSAKELLTAEDQRQVGRLMRGDIDLSDLDPERDNIKGITAVFDAKQEYEKYARQIRQWNEARRSQLRAEADEYLRTANSWKDKKKGILYARETQERNIRDIVNNRELADRIIKKYFTPVHEATAKATMLKNRMRDRVRGLDISRKVAKGNKVSEAHAVQLLGEALDNIDYLNHAKTVKERDGKSLADWRGVVQELYETNPNMDWEKVKNAVGEFRKIYNELFDLMNDSRVRNGYEPVAYRKGYFPHFQPGEGDSLISRFGKTLGISTEVTALPTTINGLTHTFRPGIQWFGNALERTGFNTAYDAVEGFDKYIEGVADVIYQTENIQRLRALASQIRYRTGDEGLRRQVDEIRADASLAEQDKENRIKDIYENGRYALSNFVVDLEEYTNLLANKKSRADRNMEQALGRNMYNLVKSIEGRIAANMVAVNPASWLTNFIPLTQGGAMLDRGMLIRGMWDTLKAIKSDDGFVGTSTFLTNRRGSDPLVRTWQQRASAKLSSPMEWIDNFTADSLVRARYRQNVQNRQMSEQAAMEEADSWVAGVMADRSKGSTPTLFNRSNPLTKMLTQFQLEVNNQLGYVFKDMPRGLREKGVGALALALFKFALGAWLYDEVYEYFIGRRPALDPIGIVNDTVGDLTGYELPNMVSLATGAIAGNVPSFKTQKGGAVSGLISNVADQLPFMGAVGALGLDDMLGLDIDAGRLSVESAIPNLGNIGKAFSKGNDWAVRKRVQTAVKEIGKPLTYILLPFGGGQMKKILQGVDAAIKGGSYTVDEKGRNIMQYPVYKDTLWDKIGAYAGGMIFGKASNSNAVKWVESNFKNYSAKATGAYQGLISVGVRGRDADELIIALAGAEKTQEKSQKQVQIDYLQKSSIPDDLKIIPYYAMVASDKEIEVIDKLAAGNRASELLNTLTAYYEAGQLKDGKTSARFKAICDSKLTDKEKITAMDILEGSDEFYAFKMKTANEYGISMKDYYAGIYGAADHDGDGKVTQSDTIETIKRLDLSTKEKAVLYQLADSGWVPKNNPFDTDVGQKVYDAVQAEKERRETQKESNGSGTESAQEEKSGARWENGRLVLPKFGESGVLPKR